MSAVVLAFEQLPKSLKARFNRRKARLASTGETAKSVDDLVMLHADQDTAPCEMNCWDDGA